MGEKSYYSENKPLSMYSLTRSFHVSLTNVYFLILPTGDFFLAQELSKQCAALMHAASRIPNNLHVTFSNYIMFFCYIIFCYIAILHYIRFCCMMLDYIFWFFLCFMWAYIYVCGPDQTRPDVTTKHSQTDRQTDWQARHRQKHTGIHRQNDMDM